MNVADKDRLSKLVGMLGSSFDGERANAARLIQAMADKYKLTVDGLMKAAYSGGNSSSQNKYHNDPPWREAEPEKPKPKPKKPKPAGLMPDDMLEALRECLDMPTLTPWEQQFAADVSDRYDRDYQLSEKQLVIIERILEKAVKAGYWGGF